jgi:hypothetical protein
MGRPREIGHRRPRVVPVAVVLVLFGDQISRIVGPARLVGSHLRLVGGLLGLVGTFACLVSSLPQLVGAFLR